MVRSAVLLIGVVLILKIFSPAGFAAQSQAPPPGSADEGERIVTPEEVRSATHPAATAPLKVIFYPFHLVNSGLESGLIRFEKHRIRERMNLWTAYLRDRGITTLFGGLGEGTGVGLGGTYTRSTGERSALRFLGRVSFTRGYQEFDGQWSTATRQARLVMEGSYQWRPQENFYGLGMDSKKSDRTQFALRQTWSGVRFEFLPLGNERVRFGSEYRLAWLSTEKSTNPAYASPGEIFPGLPGFDRRYRMQTVGVYAVADGIQGEYQLGGMVRAGVSYQDGLGSSRLEYVTIEGVMEGRLPIAPRRSALVGQADIELDRPRGGSEPIPFFLLSRVGGSSTLRGFRLDRFYGKNTLFLTLEYRYQIHPNYQSYFFFDEGQLFDRTDDLAWLNWQRNYGIGLRMHSRLGSLFRLEFGWSKDGFLYHINWGNRERRPLGGPIRYGSYRR